MAIRLAADHFSDAEITDGIGVGDIGSAARLWVRQWPTTLSAARQYVEPAEVPGLAAEALIGTIAAIAVGRGPREDVAAFLQDAVRELGEDDEPPAASTEPAHPDVFASPLMTTAFTGLPARAQEVLRATVAAEGDDAMADALIADDLGIAASDATEVRLETLTALQRDYLAVHTEKAQTAACRQTHEALAAAAEEARPSGLSTEEWVHLSACAWCTEAFHEVAFSNVALGDLVEIARPAAVVVPLAVPVAAVPPAVAPAVVAPIVVVATETAGETAADPTANAETVVLAAVPAAVPASAAKSKPPAKAPKKTSAKAAPGRRRRVIAVGVLAAAAIVATTLVANSLGGPDDTAPVADADTTQNAFPTAPTSYEPTLNSSPTATATKPTKPTASSTPTPTVANVVPVTDPDPTPETKPTKKPKPTKSPRPSATAKPSSAPSTAAPTKDPDPEPTPTPTKPPCNAFQHFLGIC